MAVVGGWIAVVITLVQLDIHSPVLLMDMVLLALVSIVFVKFILLLVVHH